MSGGGGGGQRLGFFEHRGRRVAFASAGSGPPLICDLGQLHHLDVFWRYPPYRRLVEALAQRFTVIRFDRPGCGLSDRAQADFTLDGELELLDRLLGCLQLDSAPFLAAGSAAKVVLAAAALRPRRVRRLAVFGVRMGPLDAGIDYRDAMEALLRTQIEVGIDVLARRTAEGCGPAAVQWLADAFRQVGSGDVIARWLRQSTDLDVRGLLGRVRCPTLVLHRRDDRLVDLRSARDVAAQVGDGLLVPLDGGESVVWEGDTEALAAQVARFMAESVEVVPERPGGAELTAREREVAALASGGLTNAEIGSRLGIGHRTVESHLERVRSKLGLRSRADLAAWVTRARIEPPGSGPSSPGTDGS